MKNPEESDKYGKFGLEQFFLSPQNSLAVVGFIVLTSREKWLEKGCFCVRCLRKETILLAIQLVLGLGTGLID